MEFFGYNINYIIIKLLQLMWFVEFWKYIPNKCTSNYLLI